MIDKQYDLIAINTIYATIYYYNLQFSTIIDDDFYGEKITVIY